MIPEIECSKRYINPSPLMCSSLFNLLTIYLPTIGLNVWLLAYYLFVIVYLFITYHLFIIDYYFVVYFYFIICLFLLFYFIVFVICLLFI
jgi:hypothetical protein